MQLEMPCHTTRTKQMQRKAGNATFKSKGKESGVLYACIRLLHFWGCDVTRCNTGSMTKTYTSKKTGITKSHYVRFGKKGMGDIIACSPHGRWIEVETKAEKGKQSPEQIDRQHEIERRKGVYILARSVDDLIARQSEVLRP